MVGPANLIVLHLALLMPGGSEYQEAFDRADQRGKSLLVLVGSDRCPGCRVMKDRTLPQLQKAGSLRQVVFTTVDVDAKPKLSRQVMRGDSIPQLVLYTRVGKLWRRTHLTGAQTAARIRAFLKREIAAARIAGRKAARAGVAARVP
jgi:thioredoxin-like negative regulator of GroEL